MGTIAKIHEMLVNKQVSCEELTKSYLSEIEKANPELNAYVCVTPEAALETAQAVDKKIAAGEEIGSRNPATRCDFESPLKLIQGTSGARDASAV